MAPHLVLGLCGSFFFRGWSPILSPPGIDCPYLRSMVGSSPVFEHLYFFVSMILYGFYYVWLLLFFVLLVRRMAFQYGRTQSSYDFLPRY